MATETKKTWAPGIKFTALDFATFALPALPFMGLGLWIGWHFWSFALGLILALGFSSLWGTILFSKGYDEVGARSYLVIQRFGNFRTVLLGGMVWINPYFDEVRASGDFTTHEFRLFKDDPDRAEIDFTDGSAPVAITAAYAVGHAGDLDDHNWEALSEAARKFTYRYKDPVKRIDTLLDGALRPRLQKMSIDDAQKGTDDACRSAASDAKDDLAEFGVYQPANHAIVVEDIDLPDSIKQARELPLLGKNKAAEQLQELQAPARGILAVRDALKDAGMQMSDEAIVQMIMTQKGLDTIGKTGANVSLYGFDVPALLKTLGVNTGG